MADNAVAERAEQARDLRAQIGGLAAMDSQEIIFKDVSPRVGKATVYSMRSGRPAQVPLHLLQRTLEKQDRDGTFLFTAFKDKAPEFKRGQVKCFLHPESDERSLLDEIGLAAVTCPGKLASTYSKRLHAEHRHSSEWALYQEVRKQHEDQDNRDRQDRQLEATLAIARGAAGNALAAAPIAAPVVAFTCDTEGCTRFFDSDQGLKVHVGRDHKGGE